MSNIVITEENLPRFNKRLKQAIEKELGIELPLALASKFFAQALGTQDSHELKVLLKKDEKIENKGSTNLEIQPIIDFIFNYFKDNKNTKINNFSLIQEEHTLCFNLQAPSVQFPGTYEGFGIYFGEDLNHGGYFKREQDNLALSEEDKKFLKELTLLLNFDDLPKNVYLGERLKEYAGISKYDRTVNFEFHNLDAISEVGGYGFVKSKFIIVEGDFFEKVGAPFALNSDQYVSIDLKGQQYQSFDSIKEAFTALKNNQMIVELLDPLKKDKAPLSSYYIYKEDDKITASTVNGQQKREIIDKDDYFKFLGQNYFNLRKSTFSMPLQYMLAVNHPQRELILEGYQYCTTQPKPKILNKK